MATTTKSQNLKTQIEDLSKKIINKEALSNSLREQLFLMEEKINKKKEKLNELKKEYNMEVEKEKPLNIINIMNHELISNELIDRTIQNQYQSKWYYNLRLTTGEELKPIFPMSNNRGTPEFYISPTETTCRKFYLWELQVGDIVRHNFTKYYRNVPEYCVVVKKTPNQTHFQPFRKLLVGYEGDFWSFNEEWFKFSENREVEPTIYKMNNYSKFRGASSANQIDKYLGSIDNMYSSQKYDGGA